MTFTLVRKLLRDVRPGWAVVALLLFAFQLLWAKVAQRIVVELLAGFRAMGVSLDELGRLLFQGSGQIVQTIMGGGSIQIDRALDMVSISYVHPLTQTILCVWAIGRASGAIAGEIDRGTMELLLAQPIRRSRVVLAHLLVDLVTIPTLCLAMGLGTYAGTWLVGFTGAAEPALHVDPWRFLPAQLSVGLLVFATSGLTMAASAAGRFRGRVLGVAVLAALVQFLVNVIGQMWPPLEPLRPFTVFYYYQPQPVILNAAWYADPSTWQRLGVLAAVGTAGYALALTIFCRRDLPAPL